MKKQIDRFRLPTEEEAVGATERKKRLYEKPEARKVKLFADRVLSPCPLEGECGSYPSIAS
jgi:hypothetical protein